MRVAFCLTCLTLCTLFVVAACSSSPTLPTTVPNGSTVVVPFSPSPQDVTLPTLLPTVVIPPTSLIPTNPPVPVTVIPTITPIQVTATAVVIPRPKPTATLAETVTPIPEGLPKVFVTTMHVEPATPKANVGGTFFVTFQNASGENQGYNWAVEIWDTDNLKRPYGLTTPQNSAMPVGVTNLTSIGWTVKGLGECHAYRARVVARDEDDNRETFIEPDGNIFWLDFSVCP